MHVLLKLAIWAVVLAACAGVGAFIASRSDPFPPSVADPGSLSEPRASASPRPTPAPGEPWTGAAVVRSRHGLLVGGSCRTSWRVRLRIRVLDAAVTGSGTARLRGEPRCDFPTAQLQARTIRLEVAGELEGALLVLRFTELDREPVGSIDLGGFAPLLDRLQPRLTVAGDVATGSLDLEVPDGDRGTYGVAGELELSRVG